MVIEPTTKLRCLGVDACRDGWVGISNSNGATTTGYFATTISELVAAADADGRIAVVGIDIPIGLADRSIRQADIAARKRLGARASTLFTTPVRAAIQADSYTEALRITRELGLPGISRQAYALRKKVLDVDQWRGDAGRKVVEIHPELSFAKLAGKVITAPKRTWNGAARRRHVLAEAGIDVPSALGIAGDRANVDDVLDAAAVYWSATRVARGLADCYPDPPERLADGTPSAVWA